MGRWKLYFDGACEPVNPGGVATYGWVLYRPDGTKHTEDYQVVADGAKGVLSTNNVAEYAALHAGLWGAVEAGAHDLACYGDSKLVVKTVGGSWKCRKPHLVQWHLNVKRILALIPKWQIFWIPREQNAEADALSHCAYREYALVR